MIRPFFGAALALVMTTTLANAQNLAGQYNSSEGDLYIWNTNRSYPTLEGVYGADGGHLYLGVRKHSKQIAGKWTENYSNHRCETPYNGTYYWGTVFFKYGIPGLPKGMLVGEWTYCNWHPGGTNSSKWIAVPKP